MIISSKSKMDLLSLELKIREINPDHRWMFVAGMQSQNVMIVRNWFHRLMIWISQKRYGKAGRDHAIGVICVELNKRAPEAITEMFNQTIQHIRRGKDTEEVGSVGGLCQREINIVVAWLKMYDLMMALADNPE